MLQVITLMLALGQTPDQVDKLREYVVRHGRQLRNDRLDAMQCGELWAQRIVVVRVLSDREMIVRLDDRRQLVALVGMPTENLADGDELRRPRGSEHFGTFWCPGVRKYETTLGTIVTIRELRPLDWTTLKLSEKKPARRR